MKFLILFIFVFAGCASGRCNRAGKPVDSNSLMTKVFVYKYDGSKQCEDDEGVSLEEMKKQLSGVRVFSMDKKSDGQIRVQVCGALTGRSNVYEIRLKDLPVSEALGFKKWDF